MKKEWGGEAGLNSQGVDATVLELLPNATYRLELDNKDQILAHAVGTTGRNFVRVREGDRVRVELSPHDRTRGRITQRLKG